MARLLRSLSYGDEQRPQLPPTDTEDSGSSDESGSALDADSDVPHDLEDEDCERGNPGLPTRSFDSLKLKLPTKGKLALLSNGGRV